MAADFVDDDLDNGNSWFVIELESFAGGLNDETLSVTFCIGLSAAVNFPFVVFNGIFLWRLPPNNDLIFDDWTGLSVELTFVVDISDEWIVDRPVSSAVNFFIGILSFLPIFACSFSLALKKIMVSFCCDQKSVLNQE